jgi:uncharacterized protein YndB with AHSA1/START domain
MQVEKNGSDAKTKNPTTVERKSDRELVMSRTFDAPATIVFDAWTKPELVMRWWAPRSFGMKLVKCEIDLRVGGKYRYSFEKDGAPVFEAFGKYTLVERPTRLEWTDDDQLADGATNDEATSALRLEEKGGKTTLIMTSRFPSKEELESQMTGVVPGTRETFEQLAELLAENQSNA